MGLIISRALEKLAAFGKLEKKVCMLGLDAAGKTTVLYKLQLGEAVTTIPTIGFNVEHVQYKNLELCIWDVGGQDKIRQLWRHYFNGTDALIFVVDSNDRGRIEQAQEELHKLVSADELRNASVLPLHPILPTIVRRQYYTLGGYLLAFCMHGRCMPGSTSCMARSLAGRGR